MLRAQWIIGRDAERASVAAVLARARAGAGGCIVVTGEAGIGKSTLVREAIGDTVDVVTGRATPPPSPPLRPLCELASALVHRGARVEDDRLRMHRGALGLLLPGLGDPGESEAPTPLHLADALLGLREAASKRAPCVFVLEDLHWADETTRAAVEFLGDGARARSVAIVVTLRPEGPGWLMARRLAERRSATLIELGRLGGDEVRELVSACLGGEPPPGLLDETALADGVPLLIEEILSTYEQRAELVHTADGWRFDPKAAAVPPSIADSVSARLAALTADQRCVVEAAALLGREFDAGLLPAALEMSPSAVDSALRAALDIGLLGPEPGAARLRFSHALVCDAVLGFATGAARQEVARKLLVGLAPRLADGRDLQLGAALAALGGQPNRAADLLERSGRLLLARGLPAAAVDCFDQALAASPLGPSALELREALLQALALAGDVDRATSEGEVVQRQLIAIGADEGRLHSCTTAMARAAVNAGRWIDAQRLLVPALGAAVAPATAALAAVVALTLGRFAEAEAAARQAVDAHDAEPAAVCEAAEVLGRLARRTDLDEANRWFGHAAATAELHDLALWRARALHELATIDQLRTLAVAGLVRARDAAIAASAPGLLSAVEFHLAAVYGVRFEPDLALAAARRCLDTARHLGARRQEAWAWNLIGQAHAVGGDRIRAKAAAAEAITLAEHDPEISGVALGTARGLASLLADDRDLALAEWAAAVSALRELPNPTPLPPWYLWPLLATVHDVEGDEGVRARAETDTRELRVASGPDGLWHLAAAIAHGRTGDTAAAEHSAALAAECFALVPSFAGYVHLGHRIAADGAITGGWGRPAEWLEDATTWFGGRGFDDLAKACRSLGRRAGVRQRRKGRGDASVPPDLDRLGVTSREVDVLRLLAQGLTNREIAERLYIAPRTVKGHIESLLAKTGTANRTQLAALAEAHRA